MFTIFFLFIVLQRLAELWIAKKNERWMRVNGALEFGKSHYRFIVLLHISFLFCFLLEVQLLSKELHSLWPIILLLFLVTQCIRVWAITSLGKYWNTKILIIPNAVVVQKGPYRFLRHPNYFIVSMEIILIPLLFQAYITAIVFTVLNIWMLSVRIPIEEEAFTHTTSNYALYVEEKSRFAPKINKNLE